MKNRVAVFVQRMDLTQETLSQDEFEMGTYVYNASNFLERFGFYENVAVPNSSHPYLLRFHFRRNWIPNWSYFIIVFIEIDRNDACRR